MFHQLAVLIVDESKWLTASLGLALLAVTTLHYRCRNAGLPVRRRILAAMTLFAGVTIGTMALGHLLAVTTKMVLGTLQGSAIAFYAIGAALAVPAWLLIYHTRALLTSDNDHGQKTVLLTAWLALTLLVLGLHNLPLALPAILSIGYYLHRGRAVGWLLIGAAIAINMGLLVGSLMFFASGQSFEQFRGIR
jgi:Na+/H+ antiporter NhaC